MWIWECGTPNRAFLHRWSILRCRPNGKISVDMNVVISQPMFFPWVGMFEQIRLADVYIHYSDVQFSKGGFVNRVQIKTASGIKWLTVPLEGVSLGQKINQVRIDDRRAWREQ